MKPGIQKSTRFSSGIYPLDPPDPRSKKSQDFVALLCGTSTVRHLSNCLEHRMGISYNLLQCLKMNLVEDQFIIRQATVEDAGLISVLAGVTFYEAYFRQDGSANLAAYILDSFDI